MRLGRCRPAISIGSKRRPAPSVGGGVTVIVSWSWAGIGGGGLAGAMAEDQGGTDRPAGTRVGEAERARRGVAGGVQPRQWLAGLGEEGAAVGVGARAALGGQASGQDLDRVERPAAQRGEDRVRGARVAHEAIVGVVAAAEVVVMAGVGLGAEALDGLVER